MPSIHVKEEISNSFKSGQGYRLGKKVSLTEYRRRKQGSRGQIGTTFPVGPGTGRPYLEPPMRIYTTMYGYPTQRQVIINTLQDANGPVSFNELAEAVARTRNPNATRKELTAEDEEDYPSYTPLQSARMSISGKGPLGQLVQEGVVRRVGYGMYELVR